MDITFFRLKTSLLNFHAPQSCVASPLVEDETPLATDGSSFYQSTTAHVPHFLKVVDRPAEFVSSVENLRQRYDLSDANEIEEFGEAPSAPVIY